jgi:hypothetical protein
MSLLFQSHLAILRGFSPVVPTCLRHSIDKFTKQSVLALRELHSGKMQPHLILRRAFEQAQGL